jgi:hypothetical protein
MKIQNIFRTQLMIAGFGVALVLASSAPAQEIDNTVWADNNTTVMPAEQPAAPAAATQPAANDLSSTTPDSGAINLAAMSTTSIAERESVASQWKPTQDWLITAMVVCIMLAGVYAYVTTRRASTRSEHQTRRNALS